MIYTGPLSAYESVMTTYKPSHVISLLSPNMMMDHDTRLASEKHLRLSLNDISSERQGFVAPDRDHIDHIISFINAWSDEYKDSKKPLFIHCFAGISRSPAATYMAMCLLNPELDEMKLARVLRSVNRAVSPNLMMIKLADAALKRGGRMIKAIENIGRGEDAWEGEVFPLPRYFPAPAGDME